MAQKLHGAQPPGSGVEPQRGSLKGQRPFSAGGLGGASASRKNFGFLHIPKDFFLKGNCSFPSFFLSFFFSPSVIINK